MTKKRPAMCYVIANSYLEFVDKDHARLEAYRMTVFAPARVAAAGREVDELVRLNGQWLIKSRDRVGAGPLSRGRRPRRPASNPGVRR
jgi:hypothetical protein